LDEREGGGPALESAVSVVGVSIMEAWIPSLLKAEGSSISELYLTGIVKIGEGGVCLDSLVIEMLI
jgi:hypothetical protein